MTETAPRAFYRWELPADASTVDFHLNLIELLERDVFWAEGKVAAGILLGRASSQRNMAITVEHYDRITPEAGAQESPFGDHGLIERSVSRWRQAQTRMKPVGFYRTCARGRAALTEEDIATAAATFAQLSSRGPQGRLSTDSKASNGSDAEASECLFLLIEPGEDRIPCRAVLFVLRNGEIVSESPSTVFSRHGLTNRRASRSRAPEGRSSAVPFERTVVEPVEPLEPLETSDLDEPVETQELQGINFSLPSKYYLIAGSVALGLILIAGLFEMSGRRGSSGSATRPEASMESGLSLKLQRVGNDLQLSWNPTAAAIVDSAKGRLLINDGSLQKTVELGLSDLHGGTVIYSPMTNDVVMRLEVEGDGARDPVSESVRMVEGLPVPLPPNSPVSIPSAPVAASQPMSIVTKSVAAAAPGDARIPARVQDLPTLSSAKANPNSSNEALEPVDSKSNPIRQTPAKFAHESSTGYPKSQRSSVTTPEAKNRTLLSETKTPVSSRVSEKPVAATQASPSSRVMAGLVQPESLEKIPVISASHGTSAAPFAKANVPADSIGSSAAAVAESGQSSYTRTRRGGAIEPAQLVLQQNPVYPSNAKQLRISGTVEIHFKIGTNGQVHDIRAVSGPNILAQAAIEAVQARKYKPSLVEGVPTETDASAVFLFKLY